MSRTTIDRAFDELESAKIIDCQGTECELTLFGELALSEFENLSANYDSQLESRELLAKLPKGVGIDVEPIIDADIEIADERIPFDPMSRGKEIFKKGENVRGFFPVVSPYFISVFQELAFDVGIELELILEEELIEILMVQYSTEFTELRQSANCNIVQVPELPTFGMVIVDDRLVWIGVFHESGALLGSIVNDATGAVEWAKETFRRYRNQAKEVMLRGGIREVGLNGTPNSSLETIAVD